MNFLSLFDGMGCFAIALQELNIKVDNYFACEIDKFATKQTNHNFKNIKHLGDVRFVEVNNLPFIDFVTGGSPCTDLSFAGTGTGLLYSSLDEYLKLRNEYLRTGNEDLYFHNGKFQESVLFWEYLRILKAVQEINPKVKFLLENVRMNKNQQRIINEALGLFPVALNSNKVSAQNRYRLYWTNVKTKRSGLFGELHTDIPEPADKNILLKDILQPEEEVAEKYYLSNQALKYLQSGSDEKYSDRLTFLNHESDTKSVCVTKNFSKGVPYNMIILKTGIIRRLTPKECATLQTVPEWYKWIVSDTQIYKMCGNGWTIEMIKHILSFL